MITTEQSFSWGADTLSRDRRWGRRKRSRSTRSRSLLNLRASAVIIDGLVLLVPGLLLDYLLSLVFPNHGFFIAPSQSANGSYYFGIEPPGLLVLMALWLSYFFLYEAVRGQTIGKRAMGLRVHSASGGPAGLNAISGRTVLRLIDGAFLYLIGTLVAILSGHRRRRLGDLVGGTVVVRDEGGLERPPQYELWRVAIYPGVWMLVVVFLVFTLGLGSATGERDEAVTLVRSYVKAREQGNARQACSLLTLGEQREVAALGGIGYRNASAAQCPEFILKSSSDSNLRNPALAAASEGRLATLYTQGAVLLHSAEYPEIHLVAVSENGQLRLDVRGLERLGFINSCSAAGQLTSPECNCAWDLLRAQGMLPDDGLTRRVRLAMLEDRTRCLRGGEPAGARS
jgi:uncharacterized RDD family membrane protein YckC